MLAFLGPAHAEPEGSYALARKIKIQLLADVTDVLEISGLFLAVDQDTVFLASVAARLFAGNYLDLGLDAFEKRCELIPHLTYLIQFLRGYLLAVRFPVSVKRLALIDQVEIRCIHWSLTPLSHGLSNAYFIIKQRPSRCPEGPF